MKQTNKLLNSLPKSIFLILFLDLNFGYIIRLLKILDHRSETLIERETTYNLKSSPLRTLQL